jgi:hypothetical protein
VLDFGVAKAMADAEPVAASGRSEREGRQEASQPFAFRIG